MARFFWICLGGAIGTGGRYLLSGWLAKVAGAGFPYGTLGVNLLGSFLLSLVMQLALTTGLSPATRLFVATGLVGGFTTYSTFNYETLQSLEEGAWSLGLLNLGATVLGCLVAGLLGIAVGRMWLGK
ncbi:MAG TPA: fluoride efflux transporter CrcB [Thermoanaerobaculia bacterium]|nr:fluoride efflux transporter CrcB [Thermoanaerobaculia bacterium]